MMQVMFVQIDNHISRSTVFQFHAVFGKMAEFIDKCSSFRVGAPTSGKNHALVTVSDVEFLSTPLNAMT